MVVSVESLLDLVFRTMTHIINNNPDHFKKPGTNDLMN
jgi:hypothetical protein